MSWQRLFLMGAHQHTLLIEMKSPLWILKIVRKDRVDGPIIHSVIDRLFKTKPSIKAALPSMSNYSARLGNQAV